MEHLGKWTMPDNYTENDCDDWASPFVKKGDEANKFETDFNNLPTMIAFLMGFYVNMVVVRWWDQICLLPDTDNACLYLSTYMTGEDPEAELELKKKVLRYLNLSWVLSMSRVSSELFSKFPTEAAYLEKKLVTQKEIE